jgi:hypothetical protein
MPQLQINQGPQDALLYDNTRSYFTNVGYVRTSNFQTELRDVDPQNSATLGSTIQFVIPKAADLLGPCDLMLEFTDNTTTLGNVGNGASLFAAWVEAVGFAIIDKIVFSVGSHDIETITGDQLYITNELMRGDEHRFAKHQVLKTGRPAVTVDCGDTSSSTWSPIFDADTTSTSTGRLIAANVDVGGTETPYNYKGKKLIIPLGLFFTKHPSQYFPLAAIAGCNDVRISVKLRTLNELMVLKTSQNVVSGVVHIPGLSINQVPNAAFTALPAINLATGATKLRCHYVHVTGPEASLLMNKEHVRLLKLWQNHNVTKSISSGSASPKFKFDFELPFLHPVQELIIVIRKVSEMSSSTDTTPLENVYDQKARAKNYFAFHGAGKDPNIESQRNCVHEAPANSGTSVQAYLKVDNFKLTLNGQERHPSLSSTGLDRNYLMNRLMPMLHSNTSSTFTEIADSSYNYSYSRLGNTSAPFVGDDFQALSELLDRKEIYVYPFALNPEGANPSGAVNFSKVSHAKLTIEGDAYATGAQDVEYRCDVWGVHYNWLQIKDGRALTSFA